MPSQQIRRALQGTFMRFNENGLLPDARITRWIEETARKGAGLPNMKTFKDAGKPLSNAARPLRITVQEPR